MLKRTQATQAAWAPTRINAPVSMTRSYRTSSSKPPRVPAAHRQQPEEASQLHTTRSQQPMAPALTVSSGAKRSTALQFTLDSAGAGTLERSELDDLSDGDEPLLAEELQRVQAVRTLSDGEQQLVTAFEAAKAASVRTSGSVDMRLVAAELRSRWGYLVKIRHALGAKTAKGYLRHLRHSFLVVRGSELEGADVVVDVQFRDQFLLPLHDPSYERLLTELPPEWVGPTSALEGVVAVMAAAMRGAFRRARVPLPPWREARALLSKWEPQWYEDESIDLTPLPERNATLAELLAPFQRRGTAGRAAAAAAATGPSPRRASADGAGAAAYTAAAAKGVAESVMGLGADSAVVRAAVPAAIARQRSAPVVRNGPMQPDVPRRIVRGFASSQQLWGGHGEVEVMVPQALPAVAFFEQQAQQQQGQQQQLQQEQQGQQGEQEQGQERMHQRAAQRHEEQELHHLLQQAMQPEQQQQQQQQQQLHGTMTGAPAHQPATTAAVATVAATAAAQAPAAGSGAAVQTAAVTAAPTAAASPVPATSPWQALLRVQLPIVKPVTQAGFRAVAFKSLDQLLPPVRTVKLGAAV